MCKERLHNCLLRPRLSQSAHIPEAARTESLDSWKLDLEIMREPVDDSGAPALASLPGQDVLAHRLIEQDQLAADGEVPSQNTL